MAPLYLLLLLCYHCHHHQVLSLGITNQRETTLVWSRSTGQPLYNAIVWLDNRTRWVGGLGGLEVGGILGGWKGGMEGKRFLLRSMWHMW